MHVATKVKTRDRLIVALDVDSVKGALDLVHSLAGVVSSFKVGSQLFTRGGPSVVQEILKLDAHVFLDLKFHDIPHQVAGSARSATRLGVSMFTIHAAGGSEMMRRAAAATAEAAEAEGIARPTVLAVSILTSMDAVSLKEIGMEGTPADAVLKLVRLAESSNVDGVVASPQEANAIRSSVRQGFVLVTPGIRPADQSSTSDTEDQRRIATPAAALAAGADYLVVGRPITGASNPADAATRMLRELEK